MAFSDSRLVVWIQQVLDKLAAKSGTGNKKNKILLSDEMERAIGLWGEMYCNNPPWLDRKREVSTLGLPSAIASELARLTTVEMKSEITGSGMADLLDAMYQPVVDSVRSYLEYGCAEGGLILKPFFDGNGISVDFVQVDCFYPTAFDSSGRITGAIFADQIRRNNRIATKIEWHEMTDSGYRVINMAFSSSTTGALGHEIPLSDVDEWAALADEVTLTGVDIPLFGYFKVPQANRVDSRSPMGSSVFSGSVGLLKAVDEQYSRIVREYELTEPALFVNAEMLRIGGSGQLELPGGKDRLYRKFDVSTGVSDQPFFEEWSPEIRDTSLFNGLNRYLQRIEFDCGLAYGTLSDVQMMDKTATEVKASKQRSYSTVSDLQKALQVALEGLVDAMAVYVRLYHLAPDGAYEVSFNFDDSIVVDKDTELLAMQQDVVQGLLRPEIYIAKKYGVSEEEALKMMPEKVKMDENGDFIDEESNDFANDKNEPNKADNSRNDGGDG